MRKAKGKTEPVGTVASGAVPAEALEQSFPSIRLPIHPPYPPAEAKSVAEIPSGEGWLYEPKWDGFRCLAFRSGAQVLLKSKAGQPLGRYFPELVTALRKLPHSRFVVDSEIVIYSGEQLAFDDLLMRIHPAESRIRKLSNESPATLMCFDLLVDHNGKLLTELSLAEHRAKLQESSDYTVSSANAFDFDHGCAFTAAIRLIESLGDDSIQAHGAQFAHPVFCLVSIVRGWGKAKHAFCGQVFYRQIMEKFL